MAIRNQIQFRRGSSTEWVAISGGEGPALSYGEPGFDVTNNILKIGDGSTAWKDLKAIGADQSLYKVKNTSGGIIYKGQVVRANGTVGNSDAIQVTLFIADGSVPEYTIMGLATQDMNNNDFGYVTAFGQIRGIDTNPNNLSTNICAAGETWVDGDVLYASPSASGKLTKNIPQHETIVAIVLSAADNGSLFVRPTWYPHLSDLHDVDSSGVANNQYLIYNSGTGLWGPTSSGIFTGVDISSNVSGATLLNIEGTNGNLFSVVDNMSGSLMSVNDITGLPAFEVFSDHSIVAGRFNTNDFVISSGGNVLVGTSSGNYKFQVYGSGNDALFGYADTGTAGGKVKIYVGDNDSNSQGLKVYVDKTSGSNFGINGTANGSGAIANYGVYGYAAQATTNFALYGYAAGGSDNRGLWVDAGYAIFDDRVGIGTSSPQTLVHISGSVSSTYGHILLDTSSIATTTHLGIGNSNTRPFLASVNGDLSNSTYGWGFLDRGTEGNFQISRKNGSTSWTNALTIQRADGNIGIGTTTPSQIFQVGPTTPTGATPYALLNGLRISGGDTSNTIWNAGRDIAISRDSGGLISLSQTSVRTIGLTVNTTNGNVGLGTTSAGTILSLQRSDATSYTGTHNSISNNGIDIYNNQSSVTDAFAGISFRVAGSGYTNVGTGSINLVNTGDGDGDLTFVTRNNGTSSEKLRITYDGKVGIGTSSPGHKLTVDGVSTTAISIKTPWAANAYGQLRFDTGTGSASIRSNVPGNSTLGLEFYTYSGGAESVKMSILGDGKVGIGLTDPDEKLEVNGNIHLAANGILYFGVAGTNTKIIDDNGSNRTVLMARGDTFDIINAAGNGFSATLRTGIIAGGSTATNNLVLKSTTGVGTTDYISLAVGNNGGTEGIRIINNGNVGIGTTTPSEKLEINGNLSFSTINSKIYLRNDSARIVGIENEQSSPNSDLNLFARGISSGWHGNIKFYTSYNTNVLTERVRITSDGNVGIGTSSPSQKLHVLDNIVAESSANSRWLLINPSGSIIQSSTSEISLQTNSQNIFRGLDGWTGTWADSAATSYFQVGRSGGNTIFTSLVGVPFNRLAYSANKYLFTNQTASITVPSAYFNVEYGGTTIIAAKTDGNVGLGTSSPGAKLDVRGSAVFNDGGADFDFRVEGDTDANLLFVDASTDRIGIGTSAPGCKLQVIGNIGISTTSGGYRSEIRTDGLNTSASKAFYFVNSAGSTLMTMAYGGNVGIGTSTPSTKLHVVGIGNFGEPGSEVYIGYDNLGSDLGITTSSEYIAVQTSDSKFRYGGDGVSVGIVIDSSYNVGVGTESPTYKLQVNGSFGATTKSFRIDHPSRPNYTLEYGSLESPYHGVRLTGRGRVVKGSGTVLLPSYLKDLIHDDETINIQITNIKHGKTIYVDEIDLNNDQFTVRVDRAKTLGTLEFFWTFTGTRKDVDKLVVEAEK